MRKSQNLKSHGNNDCIKVALRIRPKNEKEKDDNCQYLNVVENSVLAQGRNETKQFTFDYIASEDATQMDIFDNTAKDICNNVLEGYNGTIFVYGQTGAGKTYTLFGPKVFLEEENEEGAPNENIFANADENLKGILPNSIEYIFNQANLIQNRSMNTNATVEFSFSCSFLEIYMEQISDLLNPNYQNKNLNILSSGDQIIVEGLSKLTITSAEEAYNLVLKGCKLRHIAYTHMNKESSRSHAVFMLYVDVKTKENNTQISTLKRSVLHLIDLAGSERQSSTNATGVNIKEAGMINKSLMNLGFVIKTLAENSANQSNAKHIHFRDSKLTYLLKDSLGGNSKTYIISNVSPSIVNYGETISTLNFAQRAKLVKNKATINEISSSNSVYQNEIQKLKEKYKAIKEENVYLLSLCEQRNIFKGSQGNVQEKVISQTLDSVECEIEQIRNESGAKEEKIKGSQKHEKMLRDNIQKFELDAALKEKELVALDEKIKNLQASYESKLNEIKEFNSSNNTLSEQLNLKQQEINEIKIENNKELLKYQGLYQDTVKLLDSKNQQVEKASEQKAEILRHIQQKDEEIQNYNIKLQMVNQKISECDLLKKKKQQEIQDLKQGIEKIKEELVKKNENILKQKNQIISVKNKCNKHILDFENKTKEINEQIKKVNQETLNFNSKKTEIVDKIKAEKANRDKVEKKLFNVDREIEEKEKELTDISNKKKKVQQEIIKVGEENQMLKNSLAILTGNNNQPLEEGIPYANKVKLLEHSKKENADLKEQLNEIKNALDNLQRNLKNLNNIPVQTLPTYPNNTTKRNFGAKTTKKVNPNKSNLQTPVAKKKRKFNDTNFKGPKNFNNSTLKTPNAYNPNASHNQNYNPNFNSQNHIPSESKPAPKENLYVIADYMQKQDEEYEMYTKTMINSIERIKKLLPPIYHKTDFANIQEEFQYYVDTMLQKIDEDSEIIEKEKEEGKKKDENLFLLKKELEMLKAKNINTSFSDISVGDKDTFEKIMEGNKRKTWGISSVVKDDSHVEKYKNIFEGRQNQPLSDPFFFNFDNKNNHFLMGNTDDKKNNKNLFGNQNDNNLSFGNNNGNQNDNCPFLFGDNNPSDGSQFQPNQPFSLFDDNEIFDL
ncbi:MAG: hypothetical protein MJ252_11890, partial [archaeon]|nr:hypothetical protein [archaeon]